MSVVEVDVPAAIDNSLAATDVEPPDLDTSKPADIVIEVHVLSHCVLGPVFYYFLTVVRSQFWRWQTLKMPLLKVGERES